MPTEEDALQFSYLTDDEALTALRASKAESGRAVLLVPTPNAALDAQRALAREDDLSVGVSVVTPEAWVAGMWSRYGDGRALVSAAERQVLANRAVHEADDATLGPVGRGAGMARLVARLAAELMHVLPINAMGDLDERLLPELTPGERAALRLVASYQAMLAARHRVESCVAMRDLPGLVRAASGATCGIVLSGFTAMTHAQRTLLARLGASGWRVTLVLCPPEGPAGAQARNLALALGEAQCECDSLRVLAVTGADRAPGRTPELSGLLDALFRPEAERSSPSGAVRLLHAAGPLAEAELVASQVTLAVGRGCLRVVVCAPDTDRAWRELAPKLAARGMGVSAQRSVPLARTLSGKVFLCFADEVARLLDLAREWPRDERTRWGDVPRLGSMSWWPPRAVMDFLLSDISGVPIERAWALDRKWRGDRMLTPAIVLDDLSRVSATSGRVAAVVRDLSLGRPGTAAERLRRSYADAPSDASPEARTEADAVLSAISETCRAMGRVGIACDLARDAPADALGLSDVIRVLADVLELVSVATHPVLAPAVDGAPAADVVIASPGQVAAMPPCSADALVMMGMDTTGMPVGRDDGAYELLAAKFGGTPLADPLERARAQAYACVGVPRRELLLERPLRDAEGKGTFPAVVLTELLAGYGYRGKKGEPIPVPVEEAAEDAVTANLSSLGRRDAVVGRDDPSASGSVSDSLRELVVVPRNGCERTPDTPPTLSASQIETYLECPHKWFSLRRLGLDGIDAGFSNLEKGSFAHRVLEVTHRALLREAAGIDPFGAPADPFEDPRPRLPGSRVTEANLPHARELLETEFEAHLAHQCQGAHKRSDQALVPHVASQERELEELLGDLGSTLEFERDVLLGFEPRYFELRFGGRSGASVSYAGADFVGGIDRIDVDAAGHAIVIDYKHKSRIFNAYALADKEGLRRGTLPRHVQALIYAQVLRRHLAEVGLESVGAIYLGTRGNHELSGAVAGSVADRVWGEDLGENAPRVTAGATVADFHEVLDETEGLIAEAVARMVAGDVEANPVDKAACSWCPVTDCDRRIS